MDLSFKSSNLSPKFNKMPQLDLFTVKVNTSWRTADRDEATLNDEEE